MRLAACWAIAKAGVCEQRVKRETSASAAGRALPLVMGGAVTSVAAVEGLLRCPVDR